MMTFMEALARQEGFYAAPPNNHNTPETHFNPGDIEDGRFAQSHGALPNDGGRFARFPNAVMGFAAMRALLLSAYVGLTVFQAIHKWAPSVENNDSVYVKNVTGWTGLTPTTVLTPQLIG